MSDKSYRIKTSVGGEDNVINVNLKQGVKTLNILSLEINPEDTYDVQTSDYGVIVGRVLANNAFGVPNVKVSVFIPISEGDENDYVISNEYPFKTPQSKDINGVKYNLIHQRKNSPGTFPSKNMVLDNDGTLEVYDKYFKYTTVTNESGDYMIFGVPTGTTQVHYDCDLSDIGILSQHPYDLISKGYDANLFESRVEFTNTDLSSAVHIISQDVTVFVYPFWGDKDANKIGITRKDIDINYEFTPSCVFMGSSITDAAGSYIGIDGRPDQNCGKFDSLSTSVGDIEMIRYTQDGRIEEVKDNVVGIIDGNGVWCYQIPMNLDRIGTDEYGNIVALNDQNRGIPTRARVRFRMSLTNTTDVNSSSYTAKFLVPCNPPLKYSLYKVPGTETESHDPIVDLDTDDWNNFYEFGEKTPDCCFRDLYWGKVYSVKQYYPRFHFEYEPRDLMYGDRSDELYCETRPKNDGDITSYIDIRDTERTDEFDFRGYPTRFAFDSSCISSIDIINGLNTFPYTTLYAGAEEHLDKRTSYWFYYHLSEFSKDYNMSSRGLHFCFENDWINGCIYFPRVVIQRNSEDNYDYFGRLYDVFSPNRNHYDKTYISGRHHWYYDNENKEFTTIDTKARFDDNGYYREGSTIYIGKNTSVFQNNISIFSRIHLFGGVLTKMKTMLGESVFYYKCGSEEPSSLKWIFHRMYKRLYSTDIILLGNLDDIYDSLPKLYNNLPSTTAIFPPISTPKKFGESGMNKHGYARQILCMKGENYQDELYDAFCNHDNIMSNDKKGYADSDLYANTLYEKTKDIVLPFGVGNVNEYWDEMMVQLLRRSSLFFGLKVYNVDNFLEYDVPTFINTSRICELDVHNDSVCLIPGTNEIIPINGMIDNLDISTNENRSLFATMNYDIEKCSENKTTKYRQYITTPLCMTGFEGRLDAYMEHCNCIYENEEPDNSYIMFRFGRVNDEWKGPYTQTCAVFSVETGSGFNDGEYRRIFNYCNGDLVLPKDSFYFYFGLRTGFSAIDVLKNKFVGHRKETTSETSGIKCGVDQTKYVCTDGIETGAVDVTFTGMKTPITYELYYKNAPYKKGITNSNELEIDGLGHGVYKITVIDSLNREYTSYFSVLGSTISPNIEVYRDVLSQEGCLKFISINSLDVIGVSDDVSKKKVIITTDNVASITTSTNTIIGGDDKVYTIDFSEEYENVSENTVIFNKDLKSVNISIKQVGYECVETTLNYMFGSFNMPNLTLNDVPVEYIANWKSFNDEEKTQYVDGEPDSVFSGVTYYVWDGINTAYPEKSKDRNYNFDNGNLNYNQELQYISSMCSKVFNKSQMILKNQPKHNGYVMLAYSPNYGEYVRYLKPYKYWNNDEESIWVRMKSYISGTANIQKDVPHIVGSNYPVSYDDRTFLKISAHDYYTNQGDETEANKYINNRTIKNDSIGVVDGIYGINLFGAKHKQNNLLDLPGELEMPPSGITINKNKVDWYEISGATNFFGVRTVDKRLDYQFAFKTPLLLPSGYEQFTGLSKKALVNGEVNFDLYGGFRLDYNEDYELGGYVKEYDKIKGGPTYNAKLYSEFIYQDENKEIKLLETRHNIWYKNGENSDGNIDIDHVTLSDDGNIDGFSNITLNFVDCSTDFSDGIVKYGDSEAVHVSYAPGVEILSASTEADYDIEYTVSGATYEDGFKEYFATLNGSSLSFRIRKDNSWIGQTYTDLDTHNSHNGVVFPEWARLYESETPYSGRTEELAIYRCDPVSDSEFTVTSAYTVNFQASEITEVHAMPTYSGDTYISAFYTTVDDFNNEINVILDDEDCSQYVHFVIDDSDSGKMSASFGSNSFLLIPTRKVCTNIDYGTSLKQGVVYDTGCAYYAGSISVFVDNINKLAIIRLNTPLRYEEGEESKINYGSTTLKNNNSWHTIGNIVNYSVDNPIYAGLDYHPDKLEFYVHANDLRRYITLYFEIENGLRYKVNIDFGE